MDPTAPDPRGTESPDRVETPERVDLWLDLAGVGSRGLAQLVDVFLIVVAWAALALLLALTRSLLGTWSLVLLFAGGFLLFWFYFVVYEIAWQGQTPGKRMLRLRVQKVGGYPVGWSEALLRNLLRPVDLLLGYGVGVIVMLLTPRSQRIGDLVAGTVVVREASGGAAALDRIGYAGADDGATFELPPRHYELLHDFLVRRAQLERVAAHRIEAALARSLRAALEREGRLGPEWRALSDEAFLIRLDAAYRGERFTQPPP